VENLIDFILSNIHFVVFFGWILLGLFRRKNQEETETRRGTSDQNKRKEPGPSKPTADSKEFPRPTAFPMEFPWEVFKEEPKPELTKVEEKKIEEQRVAVEAKKPRERERIGRRDPEVISSPIVSNEIATPQAVNFSRIGPNQVIQGVIWSQVLGSPRSKDPHRTSRRGR